VAVTRVLGYLLDAGLGVSALGLIVLAVGGVAKRRLAFLGRTPTISVAEATRAQPGTVVAVQVRTLRRAHPAPLSRRDCSWHLVTETTQNFQSDTTTHENTELRSGQEFIPVSDRTATVHLGTALSARLHTRTVKSTGDHRPDGVDEEAWQRWATRSIGSERSYPRYVYTLEERIVGVDLPLFVIGEVDRGNRPHRSTYGHPRPWASARAGEPVDDICQELCSALCGRMPGPHEPCTVLHVGRGWTGVFPGSRADLERRLENRRLRCARRGRQFLFAGSASAALSALGLLAVSLIAR
jgi:hypothetical protein